MTSAITTIADTYVEQLRRARPDRRDRRGHRRLTTRADRLLPRRARPSAPTTPASTLRGARRPASPRDDRDRVAAERDARAPRARRSLLHELGEDLRVARVLGSPGPGDPRGVRPHARPTPRTTGRSSPRAWPRCPSASSSLEAAYTEGIAQGLVAARRQVVGCVEQAEVWAGTDADGTRRSSSASPTGSTIRRSATRRCTAPSTEHAERATAALRRVRAATSRDEYAPHAAERDAVGAERYAVKARVFNGIDLDLARDLRVGLGRAAPHRARDAAGRASASCPASRCAEVIELPRARPGPRDRGRRRVPARGSRTSSTARSPSSTARTSTSPSRCSACEAMIAPPGGAAAMYYTGPSEDFSRPGRTWYPTLGKTRFPLWGEVSICYHEGVPGHHLQVAQVRYLADKLTRLPAHCSAWSSGHGEGWALYAERLMGELGYLDDPDYELGMLARAGDARGARRSSTSACTSSSPIPDDERYHPGETWTPELALPFVIERSMFPEDFMRSEVDRYLGLPGPGDLVQGRRARVARVPRRRQGAPRRRLRPQGLAQVRARPRQHGPRPAPRRARPLLSGRTRAAGRRQRSSNRSAAFASGVTRSVTAVADAGSVWAPLA